MQKEENRLNWERKNINKKAKAAYNFAYIHMCAVNGENKGEKKKPFQFHFILFFSLRYT